MYAYKYLSIYMYKYIHKHSQRGYCFSLACFFGSLPQGLRSTNGSSRSTLKGALCA